MIYWQIDMNGTLLSAQLLLMAHPSQCYDLITPYIGVSTP
jgi:hypothetical protein